MTSVELGDIARRIFAKLPHPDRPDEPWWTPGFCKQRCNCGWCHQHNAPSSHEIPPPDPMDDTVFRQLLIMTQADVGYDGLGWIATAWPPGADDPKHAEADDPRIALLMAVDAMLKEQR